jgi:prepilin-type N-terminal cleavage/methylation domain-containing protein
MRDEAEDGFTLVEVLVAFVILAGAVILSFQIFADGIRRLSTVETRTKTVNVARSELARLSTAKNIPEGITAGTTEGIAWKITVTPIDGIVANGVSALRPFKVEVRAADAGDETGDVPVIETILLGRPV